MNLTSVLALLGGAQAVLFALAGWIGKLWLERTLATERHSRERDLEKLKSDQALSVSAHLERLRSDLGQQQAVLSASLSASAQAGSLGHKERLSAIERMWRASTCQRSALGSAVTYWDDLYPIGGKEGEALTEMGKAYFVEQLGLDKLANRCKQEDEAVQLSRPFLGEELWSLYYGYRMLLGRSAIPLGIALSKKKKPTPPFEDPDVQRLVQRVLSEAEFKEFTSLESERLAWLLGRFESKMMLSAESLISGRQAALESHRQSVDVILAAQRLEPSDNSMISPVVP